MAEKLGEAFLELTARDGKLKAALAGAERTSQTTVSGIGAQFKKLGGNIAGSIVAGMAVFTVLQRGLGELRAGIDRAMKLESLERAFENLAGSGGKATAMLNEMNAAFRGTVDQVTTLEVANNALLLGVAKNAKEMAFLAMAGRRLGKAVGKDATFGVNSLVVGIGRQSRLMLDNIGIIVKSEQAYKDYAAQLGKTVAGLTDAEKRQAFLNATMDATREKLSRLGVDLEDSGEKWQRFKTTWVDVFTAIGSGITAVAETFHDLVRDTTKGIRDIFAPGMTAAIEDAQQTIITAERYMIVNEQALARLLAERAKREAEIVKEKERQLQLSTELHARERKAWEEQERVRESLFIQELRFRGENLKAALHAIELEKKALLEKAATIGQELQIEKWARAAAADARKKAAEEEVKIEERKQRELKRIKDEEAEQLEKHERRRAEVKRKETQIDKRVQAFEKKQTDLTVQWLREIGKAREADILSLETWRKAEIEAASGSIDRLALIDRLYRARLSEIEKVKAETRRPQWVGAEQLWKRAITITKGAEPKPAIQVMTLATKEDKEALKEAKEQTRVLKEINAKEGFVPVLR